MRPMKPADAIRAIQITTRFPAVHGAPVHIGKPELIGIADIGKPDCGDAVPVNDDEIPVFWACGVTPQAVIATMKPEFCITHYPGSHAGHRPPQQRIRDHVSVRRRHSGRANAVSESRNPVNAECWGVRDA